MHDSVNSDYLHCICPHKLMKLRRQFYNYETAASLDKQSLHNIWSYRVIRIIDKIWPPLEKIF